VSAGPGGLGEQRGEALDPAVDGGVVDLDAALGEELLDLAGRQHEAQVPAHREDDHLGREAEASEARPCEGGPDAARADTALLHLARRCGWRVASRSRFPSRRLLEVLKAVNLCHR
jgi:hypothetical protein